ncbi:MAG: Fluoroquinolones export ATP-binding protein [bacterium ADurb.Bin400]|nr:MAG: Fluoroquinolones export ATP-binding protein [bacterium ADurb.Bin400]
MDRVIQVNNLVKNYGKLTAVNGISFHVERGEIFGLLGENGAGKTTTLEIVEGLRSLTNGSVAVLGYDLTDNLSEIKRKIGVQLQSSAYYNFLNLQEILRLFGGFYGMKSDPAKLLEMVDLSDKAKSLVGSLSGGQKQRFSIVASLVNDPEIVFLDEPTTGLDPLARRNLWDLIGKIKAQGKTVVLTTHYMEEAEKLCDRIAIMDKGQILVMDEVSELIKHTKNPYKIHFKSKKMDREATDKLMNLGHMEQVAKKESEYELRLKNRKDLYQALGIIQLFKPESLAVGKASLEDLFIELTGKRIGDEE